MWVVFRGDPRQTEGMKISMIAAMARNRVIGTGDGGIPWRLPRDTLHFRDYTAGKHLLLGRRTFGEMTGWFRAHIPIVLTRDERFEPAIGQVAHSVDEAITEAFEDGAPELVVCGGASVYRAALPYADELCLTLIDAEVEGEAVFPDYEAEIEWEKLSEESHPADAENAHPMTFVRLRRIRPSSLRPSRLHLL